MALITGLITTLVGAGLSYGLAAATAPDYANPASSSKAVSRAQIRALPGQRAVEQAARLGQRVDYPTGRYHDVYETRNLSVADALAQGLITQSQANRYLNPTGTQGKGGVGPPNNLDPATKMIDVRVLKGREPVTREADFTGYGDADVQGKLARAMAEIQLDLQRKYGTDFAAEAARQAALADPEGTAARGMLADRINEFETERHNRQRPVTSALDAQLMSEVESGRGVDDAVSREIEKVLARRGDTSLSGADLERELESGPAGDARESARLQKLMSYISSGQTPQDVSYRDEQQSMANMANFLAGRTPTSQFNALASGQQGASPMPQGPNLPLQNPNAAQLATSAGQQGYSANIRQLSTQVNPLFAGLSGIVNAANAAGSAGYRPFAR